MNLSELYQELILDHGTQPRNHQKLENASHEAEGFNPLCGDKLKLFLKITNNKIVEACFQGQGCAISMASSSLMTEALQGKTLSEAEALFEVVHQSLIGHSAQNTSAATQNLVLGKLQALMGVKGFPLRVKCATLAWHTLQNILSQITEENLDENTAPNHDNIPTQSQALEEPLT